MKTTLLIFISILPLLMSGQDTTITATNDYSHYRIKFAGTNKPGEITTVYWSFPQKETNINITAALLFEYETECFNDSTEVTYDFYKRGDDTLSAVPNIDPGFWHGYLGRWSIYEHKEPTFKDFINWLHKKSEQ